MEPFLQIVWILKDIPFQDGLLFFWKKKIISLPFCTWLQQDAIHKAANFGTCAWVHARTLTHTHELILILAPSETIHLLLSLLIMTLYTDEQMTLNPEWLSLSLCITFTQVDEIILGKVKASLHSAKVLLITNTACFRDLAGKLKRNPRCSRLLSWFPGNQMLGAGRERGFLLVPDCIDRQWARFLSQGDGEGQRKPA